jgi:beta-xylosidase
LPGYARFYLDRNGLRIEPIQRHFKIACDFKDVKDTAYFYYSLDGKTWQPIGRPLKMTYSMPHFMGYRFGLFNYATKNTGGFVDFDFFEYKNNINN